MQAPGGGDQLRQGPRPCTRPKGRAGTASAETPVNGGKTEHGRSPLIEPPCATTILLLLLASPLLAQQRGTNWKATGSHGAVAAGGQGAVDAGVTTLKSGGNAIDAAAATILALSVTDSNSFCFGGEVPILVYDAKRGTWSRCWSAWGPPRGWPRASTLHKRAVSPAPGLRPVRCLARSTRC